LSRSSSNCVGGGPPRLVRSRRDRGECEQVQETRRTAIKNVDQAADEIDESRFDALPERVQKALGELAGAAKDGLLALSVGVGLRVLSELMEEEVDDVVGPKAGTMSTAQPCIIGTRPGRSRSVAGASDRLQALADELAHSHPGASASLPEGLAETVTLQRLGVHEQLWKTLSSINPDRVDDGHQPRHLAQRQALAERRHVSALDRGGHARSRAPVPQDHRLQAPRRARHGRRARPRRRARRRADRPTHRPLQPRQPSRPLRSQPLTDHRIATAKFHNERTTSRGKQPCRDAEVEGLKTGSCLDLDLSNHEVRLRRFAVEDKKFRALLRGQTNLEDCTNADSSVTGPWDRSWMGKCREQVKGCDES
jgi:hypothetical protein